MSLHKWSGFLAVVGLVAAVASGCSSSSSGPAGDAGFDGPILHKLMDASSTDDGGGTPGGGYDGTSGKPCQKDIDCVGADGGPGLNRCSNSFLFSVGGVPVQLLSTPVCIVTPPMTA